MDYSSLAITIAIIAYGVVAYRRRERLHRAELALVRRGEVPPHGEPQHPLLKLMTLGSAAALILVSEGTLVYMWSRFPRNVTPLAVIGGIFLLLFIALVVMLLRDFRRYKSRRHPGRGVQ